MQILMMKMKRNCYDVGVRGFVQRWEMEKRIVAQTSLNEKHKNMGKPELGGSDAISAKSERVNKKMVWRSMSYMK